MRTRGQWPNPVVIRRGWAAAHARPWNSSRPDAHLRLARGSSGFLGDATRTVLGFGAATVISPPLMAGTQTAWRAAGYQPYTSLRLLRKSVGEEEKVEAPVRPLADPDWPQVVAVDATAFGEMWRADLPALLEALRSAPASALIGIDDPDSGSLAGYAIVACSAGTGYLQRIAVHPEHQGRGFGRALTRQASNWLRRRGARHIILNTKPGNTGALSLYESEGYVLLPDRLELLRCTAGDFGSR